MTAKLPYVILRRALAKLASTPSIIRWDVSENDHHVLILSHREELVRQPLEYLKDLPCGIELGPLHADGEPIISASVQSLVGRLSEYNPYSIDTIIIDEAHHSAAPTYRKIFEYFKNAVRLALLRPQFAGMASVWLWLLKRFYVSSTPCMVSNTATLANRCLSG